MIRITLLGTGSPIPDADRGGPATLLQAGDTTLLVDAGRGVLMRVAGAGSAALQFDAVLLTHLHSDHLTDLGDVITTRWITSFEPMPLTVIGPPRTGDVISAIRASLQPDVEYRLAHHDDLNWEPEVQVTELTEGSAFRSGDVVVTAAPTDHRPAQPSLAYRIEHDGHAVVVAGDTVPCPGLDSLCEGADAVVHTAIRKDVLADLALQRLQDVCDYHSSVSEAAQTATRGGCDTLILTHYVPAVQAHDLEEWRALAAQHFSGRIEIGDDLHTVEIG